MILLDTNALIWLHRHDERAAPLARGSARLYVSPASLLELQVAHARLRRWPLATSDQRVIAQLRKGEVLEL